MRILVTGATGFVGRTLVSKLIDESYLVRSAIHRNFDKENKSQSKLKDTVLFDLRSDHNDYKKLLNNIDIVIHLAAKVHNNGDNRQLGFRLLNYIATERLVSAAIEYKVKRFIFLSSIKVNGDVNIIDANGNTIPFSEDDELNPNDEYAVSKMNAESAIFNRCTGTDMEYVILRPVLIHGPGVKANFLLLLNAINYYCPLPLASITNKRSIIFIMNLVDVIIKCIDSANVSNQIYLVSDYDVTVPELIKLIAKHMRRKTLLFPVPVQILYLLGSIFNRKHIIEKLTDPLLVDSCKIRKDLKWEPLLSLDDGVRSTIDWFDSVK